MATTRNHIGQSVNRQLYAQLLELTAQLPENSTFNRRLLCLISEYKALRGIVSGAVTDSMRTLTATPIGSIPTSTHIPDVGDVGVWPYLETDVFPNAAPAIESPTAFGSRGIGSENEAA